MDKKTLSQFFIFGVMWLLGSCTNPNKVHKMEEPMESTQNIGAKEQIGLKDGELQVQKKVQLGEELRKIREEVLNLEDDILGNRKFGAQGLNGKLRQCRGKIKKDADRFEVKVPVRIADTEEGKMIERSSGRKGAIDNNKNLVLLDEEGLGTQINRFQEQRQTLHKLEDEIREKLAACEGELKASN